MRLSAVQFVLAASAALLCGAALALSLPQNAENGDAAPYGTPFTLIDQDGRAISEEALRGQPTALFFGFTHCPVVCPTTLFELAGHQRALEADGRELKVAMVTVDPERDTPEVLKGYVEAISPQITAITGPPQDVTAMLKGWGVYSRRSGEGDDYTMDHTASVFLIDEKGGFAGTIAYGEQPETVRRRLRNLTD